ncbi:hypothetical protein A5M85_03455 [Cellulophaga lytica]|uniref:RagB/SusD family nutrient uptake outer membrane protein n=1 Tax=Cellulophaga lytica TaxID=979 RepID=UPI000950A9C8|nr:RagB/SusD family nutrient uptake outer membrane protein [Cellulophaga lytica]APU09369.1 hypothetical protein A5M85_03455 [Cellulophaga lytica]
MRQNIIKKILPLAVLVVTAFSCSDDLERNPYDSIGVGQSFETFADAQNWNNGFYQDIRNRVSGYVQYSTDLQADQLNATTDFGNRNGFVHRWEGFLAADGGIASVWQNYYSAITDINIALEGFETFDFEDPAELSDLNKFKANAHFARAFHYFGLVNRYAKPYNPSTASSDLGVPLVLNYDVNAQPSRSTVQEVYNQILSDLQIAKSGLAGEPGVQGATTFNRDVVLALEARVKLNMQDWVGAKSAADELINSGSYPLLTSESGLNDMWVNDFAQEVIFMPFVSAPDELPASTGAIYLGYDGGSDTYTPDFLPSQWVVDMFDDNDIRKNVYFTQPATIRLQNGDFSGVYVVNKFPGNPNLFTGAFTNYQHAPKVFRIAEMYLISAEAALNIPGADAATPLNELKVARNLPAISNPTMQDLKDERFRELAFEGFRLDDLKRWGEGFQRRDPQNTSTINLGSGYESLSQPAGADKFIWAIPSRDLTVNPGLKDQQNPGW